MKLALVTGASSGLGKALCEVLAAKGIALILVARDFDKLNSFASSLSVPTHIHKTDLSSPQEREQLIALIHKRQPDLIINNAGFGLYGPILSHPTSAMSEMLQVNAQAVLELTIESARMLAASGKKGTIVNISSAAAFFSYPHLSVYAATKAFVNSFSEGFDAELRALKIRVLTVCPGQIATAFRLRASGGHPQKEDQITMEPKSVARLVLKQIETGKMLTIIDWRYRLLVAFARLLPKKILQTILKKSLKERYTEHH